MARIIAVASGKGGVGKTTVVANLSAALARFNRSVIAVDANLTASNLGMHLGIPLYPKTLQDVLNRKASVRDVVYYHEDGFRVIPADVSLSKVMIPRADRLLESLYRISEGADFVLIDCAAGIGSEALEAVRAADEILVVTNPEMPALMDALKVARSAEMYETRSAGVVLNRVNGGPHEVPESEVEGFLEQHIIGRIPESRHVKASIATRRPAVSAYPRSPAAESFMKLAAELIGEEYRPSGMLSRIFGWFG